MSINKELYRAILNLVDHEQICKIRNDKTVRTMCLDCDEVLTHLNKTTYVNYKLLGAISTEAERIASKIKDTNRFLNVDFMDAIIEIDSDEYSDIENTILIYTLGALL